MHNKQILLVEDHPDDELLTLHTLRKNKIENVVVAREAEHALNYLFRTGEETSECRLPEFILLDLRMPKMDGFEFLEVVKADERTMKIPVVVLTSSQQSKDVDRCRMLGVAAYLNKPLDKEKLQFAISAVNAG